MSGRGSLKVLLFWPLLSLAVAGGEAAASTRIRIAAAEVQATSTMVPAGAFALVQADRSMTAGEVRKIDRNANKITLKHGEIRNLGMPAMTMVFHVEDPAMLDALESGQKVLFSAKSVNGALVVTRIEVAK